MTRAERIEGALRRLIEECECEFMLDGMWCDNGQAVSLVTITKARAALAPDSREQGSGPGVRCAAMTPEECQEQDESFGMMQALVHNLQAQLTAMTAERDELERLYEAWRECAVSFYRCENVAPAPNNMGREGLRLYVAARALEGEGQK